MQGTVSMDCRYSCTAQIRVDRGDYAASLAARQSGHSGVWTKLISGNLHINIVAREYSEEAESIIEPYIYELVGKSNSWGRY